MRTTNARTEKVNKSNVAPEQWFLHDLRRRLKINQHQVGEKAGINQTKISEIERGTSDATLDQRLAIVEFFASRFRF